MCGTVGMFAGCAALTFCPIAASATDTRTDHSRELVPPQEPVATREYRSSFHSWYRRASVRQAPRRVIDEAEADLLYFPPELVPVSSHPAVQGLGPSSFDWLMIQHLYRYLAFTTKLEHFVVNRAVLGIAHGTVQVPIPDAMRIDAHKMYCDEAYHALFSVDLAMQAERLTGRPSTADPVPYFMRRLSALTADLPKQERALAELLFVIVSETLISATLAEIPNNSQVVPAVSEVVRDHAADEGRHHAFFAEFVRHLWAALDRPARRRASLLVPELMHIFLEPDTAGVCADLATVGFDESTAREIIDETFIPEVLAHHSRETSRMTVRYFTELGAFDSAEAQDRLAQYGFVR